MSLPEAKLRRNNGYTARLAIESSENADLILRRDAGAFNPQ